MKTYLFLFLFFSNSLFAQSSLEADITAIMEKYNTVGLSVAVVKNGETIYKKAFGKKNLATGEALTETDIFRIASISKSFSATSVMQLVEANKLTLDDDLSDLMGFTVRNPNFPDTKITLRMALSHTSSINDSQGYFQLDAINPNKNPDWKKCYNSYAPGKGYEYCNLNFNMIGTIIEKKSGERFDQYVLKHILKPLNLYGGYCVDSLDNNRFATIYNYVAETKQFVASEGAYNPRREEIRNYIFGYSTPIFSPTGGMKISAPDLARYMTMHLNYGKLNKTRIIKKSSSKIMQTPILENYGLALLKTNTFIEGEKLVGHTGSAYGLYSTMFFNPKKKFGIVTITNGCADSSDEPYHKLLQEVSNLLYQRLIQP